MATVDIDGYRESLASVPGISLASRDGLQDLVPEVTRHLEHAYRGAAAFRGAIDAVGMLASLVASGGDAGRVDWKAVVDAYSGWLKGSGERLVRDSLLSRHRARERFVLNAIARTRRGEGVLHVRRLPSYTLKFRKRLGLRVFKRHPRIWEPEDQRLPRWMLHHNGGDDDVWRRYVLSDPRRGIAKKGDCANERLGDEGGRDGSCQGSMGIAPLLYPFYREFSFSVGGESVFATPGVASSRQVSSLMLDYQRRVMTIPEENFRVPVGALLAMWDHFRRTYQTYAVTSVVGAPVVRELEASLSDLEWPRVGIWGHSKAVGGGTFARLPIASSQPDTPGRVERFYVEDGYIRATYADDDLSTHWVQLQGLPHQSGSRSWLYGVRVDSWNGLRGIVQAVLEARSTFLAQPEAMSILRRGDVEPGLRALARGASVSAADTWAAPRARASAGQKVAVGGAVLGAFALLRGLR